MQCNKCKQDKDESQFSSINNKQRTTCKRCHANQTRDYRYKLKPNQYEKMKQQQNNKCLLCHQPAGEEHHKRLYVDHDHETGKVRGLVCNKHNMLLGLADDDPNILTQAAEYLIHHKGLTF